MSSFPGTFDSLPGVVCDRFDAAAVAEGQIYFLSHCHEDHMVGLARQPATKKSPSWMGLGEWLKQKHQQDAGSLLFCSEISHRFLLDGHTELTGQLRALSSEHLHPAPVTVEVPAGHSHAGYSLRVTAINAHHCPGSVMFLFERLDQCGLVTKRILYTGDFRFEEPTTIESIKALHCGGTPLHIDEMFLDTTFLSKEYPSFPTRKEAENKILKISHDWLRKNEKKGARKKFIVSFIFPAKYGHERIMQHLAINRWLPEDEVYWTGKQTHLPGSKEAGYCEENLRDCVTRDNKTLLHACNWRKTRSADPSNLPLGINCLHNCKPPVGICYIKPSAMFFSKSQCEESGGSHLSISQPTKQPGTEFHRVCYSTHSSLAELQHFVTYLGPDRVVPSVIPRPQNKETSRDQIKAEVEEILKSLVKSEKPVYVEDSPDAHESQASLENSQKIENEYEYWQMSETSKHVSQDSQESHESFSLLSHPQISVLKESSESLELSSVEESQSLLSGVPRDPRSHDEGNSEYAACLLVRPKTSEDLFGEEQPAPKRLKTDKSISNKKQTVEKLELVLEDSADESENCDKENSFSDNNDTNCETPALDELIKIVSSKKSTPPHVMSHLRRLQRRNHEEIPMITLDD